MGDERGASEVVSFVLVFSLIIATIAIVYVVGFQGLEDIRTNEALNNAERAYNVLADNMEDIYAENAPSRATEMKLSDAQVRMPSDPTVMTVTVAGNAGLYSANITPIIYESTRGGSSTRLVYEGGAVVRQERSGAVMNSEPPLIFGSDRTIIQLVAVDATDEDNAAGSTTVLVRAEQTGRAVRTVDTGSPVTATLSVDTASGRVEVWERYLESVMSGVATNGADPCTVSGTTIECEFETQQLVVSQVGVEVEINS